MKRLRGAIDSTWSRIRQQYRQKGLLRISLLAIPVLVTLLILGWLVYRQWPAIQQFKWTFHWQYFILTLVVYLILWIMTIQVWSFILRSFGHTIGFWDHFKVMTISALGKRLPGTLWYVPFRANFYKEHQVSARLVTVASGVELSVSMISAIIITGFFAFDLLRSQTYPLVGVILVLLISAVSLHPRFISWIQKVLKLERIPLNYRNILGWVGFNLLIRIGVGVLNFLLINIFFPIPIEKLVFVIGATGLVAALSLLVIFLPSNLGLSEVTYSLLFSTFLPSSIAVMIALMIRITMTFLDLLTGGLAFLFMIWRKKPAAADVTRDETAVNVEQVDK